MIANINDEIPLKEKHVLIISLASSLVLGRNRIKLITSPNSAKRDRRDDTEIKPDANPTKAGL